MLKSAKDLGEALNALLPAAVGVTVLILFGIFTKFLLDNTAASDATWNPFIYVFSAVQSIALAAATFFFGKSVNAQQEKAAEAKKAKEVAVEGLSRVASDVEKKKDERKRQQKASVPVEGFIRRFQTLSKVHPDLLFGDPEVVNHLTTEFMASQPDDDEPDWAKIAATARDYVTRANAIAP